MAEDFETISAANDLLLLTNLNKIISFIDENSVIENLFASNVALSITDSSLTTTVDVEDSASANFLDYSQLELLSKHEPEFLLSFLINNNNFLNTLNQCLDVNVLVPLMNIFAKIKTLSIRSPSDTDLFNMIENSKYLQNLKALMVIEKSISLLMSYDQLQEFCFSCMSVYEVIKSWESKIILYNIVKNTFLTMKTLYVDLNPNDQVDTELMIEKLGEVKITEQVLYDVKKWPYNYKTLPVYPVSKDLASITVKLSPNIMNGSYENVLHYLDVQFRLIREDFMAPLRQGIKCYKSMKEMGMELKTIPNMHIYLAAKIIRKVLIGDRMGYIVHFKSTENYSNNAKRFMKDSVLVFTNNNFQTSFFATVVQKPYQMGGSIKMIKCLPTDSDIRVQLNSVYTMAESDTYFLPYKYTMKVFKELNETIFPMRSFIVYGRTNPCIPAYLKLLDGKLFKINDKTFDISSDDQWPDEKFLDLDSAQRLAFKAALTEEFAVIQGPPGTGKTYIGTKIVESIIENMYKTNLIKSPILVVCYTNHALDQFLEGLLTVTKKIIRLGCGSESDILSPYIYNNLKIKTDETLRNSFVVGLTTTGASMRYSLLNKLKPKIVIVEEAAEVLESHIVTSLTQDCLHVILIGDHKQLRPRTATHTLAKKFNFDVSLFERLVRNGFPCHTLETQHRMRPEISSLVLPIYPFLKDHKSVNNRDDIRGVTKNVYFIHHEEQEEKVLESSSYKNMHEVHFFMEFVRYLLRQGYRQEQITVLVTYKEQLSELQKIRKTNLYLEYFRIDTVDGYQGEESDIILLSLVRNNKDNTIGFLNIENRVSVALSRAKNGLYIMGNMDNLIHSAIWKKISHNLVNQQSLGNKLTLRCEKHKDWVKTVKESSDFAQVQCLEVCNTLLDCGHLCKQFCHICDPSHVAFSRCREGYTKVLSCGLRLKIECWMRFLTFACPQQDIKKMDPLPPSPI